MVISKTEIACILFMRALADKSPEQATEAFIAIIGALAELVSFSDMLSVIAAMELAGLDRREGGMECTTPSLSFPSC